MRAVYFDPTTLTGEELKWWKKWSARADKKRKEALEEWEAWLADVPPVGQSRKPFKPKLDQKVWSDLKHWLNAGPFRKLCAYCEMPLMFDRAKGDAEHYRPKGSVIWRPVGGSEQRAKCKLEDGTEIPHPGYFWLAYDWRNLVPACAYCNAGVGKVDQFPVRNQHVFSLDATSAGFGAAVPLQDEAVESPINSKRYFLSPSRLDTLESPLLLNPLNPGPDRVPSQHLRFGIGGFVVAVEGSEIGQHSIDVYQLEREDLQIARQAEQENAHREYFLAYANPDRGKQDAAEVMSKYKSGSKNFSSAVLDYLDEQRRLFPT